jgi:hypothetical protein
MEEFQRGVARTNGSKLRKIVREQNRHYLAAWVPADFAG